MMSRTNPFWADYCQIQFTADWIEAEGWQRFSGVGSSSKISRMSVAIQIVYLQSFQQNCD